MLLSLSIHAAMAAEPRLLSDQSRVGDADRALVFIHGLLGSPSDSFGQWPTIIASDPSVLPGHGKLSDFAVYAVDYEADFSSRTKLDDVALGVAHDLAASQIFKRHRHIWIVAHSMGGLVLKRTIALWKLEDRLGLVDRVLGVGMLGVPSAGAPLARLAKSYGVGEIATTFGWNGDLLKDLTSDSGSYLDSLETDWLSVKTARNRAPERRFTPVISCGFETKPEVDRGFWTSPLFFVLGKVLQKEDIDTIVPKLFTSSICDEKRSFPTKHTALIKPKDQNDSIHVWLRDLIEKSIDLAEREQRVAVTAPPTAGVAEPINFNLADRINFLNQGRNQGNPEILEFADDNSRQAASSLVLRGGSFSGLTNLDAWQAAAATNKCLSISHAGNRMKITFAVKNDLVQCRGYKVCSGQTCD
jgi:pimeloyl-ACP methyl ester carboxylesterase